MSFVNAAMHKMRLLNCVFCIYMYMCMCMGWCAYMAACQVCVSPECIKPQRLPQGLPLASVLTQTRARHTESCSQAISTHTFTHMHTFWEKVGAYYGNLFKLMHDVTNNYRETTQHVMPTYCNTHLCRTTSLLFKNRVVHFWWKMIFYEQGRRERVCLWNHFHKTFSLEPAWSI